ncbi:MAG: sigma-54 dependent transcriptional regulator [Pseudomonadota bacterium]
MSNAQHENALAQGNATSDSPVCDRVSKNKTFAEEPRRRTPDTADEQSLAQLLVGESEQMRHVRSLIAQVAPSNASVILMGESGTGKELAARGIHSLSRRSSGPYVPVNCSAIPAELLESEFFGHEKGAFSGAISTRIGRFEMASQGTLFLDEIGDMPLDMQVKILRVLQEKTYERVGSNRSYRSDVRIIAATHQDIEESVRTGNFRMDLFYRLHVFPIIMPALRDRAEDIPALIRNFVVALRRRGGDGVTLRVDALDCLMQYPWPGNVRELGNLIERLAILFPDGEVTRQDLPERFRPATRPLQSANAKQPGQIADGPAAPIPFSGVSDASGRYAGVADNVDAPSVEPAWVASYRVMPDRVAADRVAPEKATINLSAAQTILQDTTTARADGDVIPQEADLAAGDSLDLKAYLCKVERYLMLQALEQNDWVIARAAKQLHLQRTTLTEKLRKHGISKPESSSDC